MIVPGFIVDNNRRLVDLAADADDVAPDNRGSIAGRDRLRIGIPRRSGRSLRAFPGQPVDSFHRAVSYPVLADQSRRAVPGRLSIQCIRGSADSAALEKLNILLGFEASNQLTAGPT